MGTDDADRRDRDAIALYLESLPPQASKLQLAILAGLALTIGARLVAHAAVFLSAALSSLPGAGGQGRRINEYQKLAEKIGAMVVPSDASAREALDAILRSTPEALLFFAVALTAVSYLVLRCLVPSFRLMRMVLNAYPAFDHHRRATPASGSVHRASGVYASERAVFAELGEAPPKELPFDLAVGAVAMLMLSLLGIDSIYYAATDPFTPYDLALGLLLIGVCGNRLASLRRTWHRRRAGTGPQPYPYRVPIREGGLAVKLDDPRRTLVVAAFALLPAVGLALEGSFNAEPDSLGGGIAMLIEVVLLCGALWWYRVSRELRELGRAHGMRLGRWPALSALAVTVGWMLVVPPVVAGYRLGRRVRDAQRLIESDDRPCRPARPWVVAIGTWLLAYPLVAAYVQGRLNDVWRDMAQAESSPAGTAR